MDSAANLFTRPLLAPRPPLVAAQAAEAVMTKHAPRRNVSSACTSCKAKRKKCDGIQPCSTCIRLDSHCHYDAGHDGRKDLKRKLVAFEKDSQCLHQLLDLIKGDNDQRAAHLIALIRKTSSVEEIEALIEGQLDIESKDCAAFKLLQEDGNNCFTPTFTSELRVPSPISMQFAASEQTRTEGGPRGLASSPATDSVHPTPSLMPHNSGMAPLSRDVFSGRESPIKTAKAPAVQHRLSRNSYDTNAMSNSPGLSRPRADLGQRDFFPLNLPLGNHSNLLVQESLSWHPSLKYNAEFFRYSSPSRLVSNNPSAAGSLRITGFPLTIEEQQLEILHKPEWSILPLAFDDGSRLCRACTSFLSAARVMIEQGTSVSAILGGERPQVDFFFVPRRLDSPKEISISHWACSLFSSFEDLERSFALIWVLLAYRLMRWMICPSVETYASLTTSQRPTLVQRTIPHSAVVDMVHLPDLRDAVCRIPRDFLSSANGTSVNWPKRLDEAVEIDPDDGSLYITREFEQHGLNLSNWTYSAEFLLTFPELEGKLRVKTP